MQRWIGLALITALIALGGAGYFALRIYKQNLPHPMWVPLQLNPELPYDKRVEAAAKIKEELLKPEVLLQVSKDLGLPSKLDFKSHDEVAAELARLVFVDVGEADTPTGIKVPAINVGVKGKQKHHDTSGKIAMRLMEDVWKFIGIKPPPRQAD
jgi:hypothetical protein